MTSRSKTPRQRSRLRGESLNRMVVSNTTPLIAFARIRELDLLQKIVGHILIPDAVWREVTQAGNRLGAEEIRNASWVESRRVRTIPPELIPLLDPGETEAIALAEEIAASELLLDERAARGLNIIGTAGLLARAKQRGFVTAVSPFLEHMQVEGLRYSRRFVEGFLKELGE